VRVVAEIPHPRFKVTVFSWNAKYIVKIEIDQYEQVYKVNEMDVEGLDQVKEMFNEEFLNGCMQRFLTMRTDFVASFQRVTN
jgi:hypothetical protein